MTFSSFCRALLLVTGAFLMLPKAAHAQGQTGYGFYDLDRTVYRSTTGYITRPKSMTDLPEFYEFTPEVSNNDVKNTMPQAWDGQDWDTTKWDQKKWTAESAIHGFFVNRTFRSQYWRGKMPVVEVGPTFYILSDLDQRRSLKLLTDNGHIFDSGKYTSVDLRDWSTGQSIGMYTPKGMYLN